MTEHFETELIITQITKIRGLGFLPKKISKEVNKIPDTSEIVIEKLKSDWFKTVVGYFTNHRPKRDFAILDDEYKVQDLLYCLLITILDDLQYEDPKSKNIGALSSSRTDLISKKAKIIIEAKYASSKHSAKSIESEISEDIVIYGKESDFDHLIFFIYCNGYFFPNQKEFERGFTNVNDISGHKFRTHCIIKP